MAADSTKGCWAEFEKVMPKKPWTESVPVKDFEPLKLLIESHTQADMFRHVGKYATNGDYFQIAKGLAAKGKESDTISFKNGSTAEVHQKGGVLSSLILEDKAAGLKEILTVNPKGPSLMSDEVEYCGVSRSRSFVPQGETSRTYNFPGGHIEQSQGPDVFKLDK